MLGMLIIVREASTGPLDLLIKRALCVFKERYSQGSSVSNAEAIVQWGNWFIWFSVLIAGEHWQCRQESLTMYTAYCIVSPDAPAGASSAGRLTILYRRSSAARG